MKIILLLAGFWCSSVSAFGCGMGVGLGPQEEDPLGLLKKIVTDQVHFTGNVAETRFIDKHLAYDLLMADTTIIDTSVILRRFVNNCRNNCIGQLYKIKQAINSGNYPAAQGLVNALDLVHPTEKNYKTYYNCFIKLQTDTVPLNPDDSTALITLCNGCPFTDGAVVYSARALYNTTYKTYIPFSDDCVYLNNGGNLRMGKIETQTNKTFDALVYPNPSNDGTLNIAPTGKIPMAGLQINVTDITGKNLFAGKVNTDNGTGTLKLDVGSGIYFMLITNMDTYENTTKKVVITK